MARLRLLEEREGLTDSQLEVYDAIVESRGSMIRPYEVLLHVPGLAMPAARLGHQIRYEGVLSDHDRELAIIATAKVHDCQFEWDSHIGIARSVGVRDEVIDALEGGEQDFTGHEALIVGFVRELCDTSTVSQQTYDDAERALGSAAVVELSALVGYYTFLGYAMNVAGAC
jgi:4-carboxymuconolactone decarboxylase